MIRTKNAIILFLVLSIGFCIFEADENLWLVSKRDCNNAIVLSFLSELNATSSELSEIASCFPVSLPEMRTFIDQITSFSVLIHSLTKNSLQLKNSEKRISQEAYYLVQNFSNIYRICSDSNAISTSNQVLIMKQNKTEFKNTGRSKMQKQDFEILNKNGLMSGNEKQSDLSAFVERIEGITLSQWEERMKQIMEAQFANAVDKAVHIMDNLLKHLWSQADQDDCTEYGHALGVVFYFLAKANSPFSINHYLLLFSLFFLFLI
jgi:hypothetical protein